MPEEVDKDDSPQENGSTSPEKQPTGGFDSNHIKNIVVHHAKIVLAALAIWTVGWLGLHYVWVLMGLLIFAIWRMNQKDKERRMKSLREVTTNERKALARVKNLPSWVSRTWVKHLLKPRVCLCCNKRAVNLTVPIFARVLIVSYLTKF